MRLILVTWNLSVPALTGFPGETWINRQDLFEGCLIEIYSASTAHCR